VGADLLTGGVPPSPSLDLPLGQSPEKNVRWSYVSLQIAAFDIKPNIITIFSSRCPITLTKKNSLGTRLIGEEEAVLPS